MRLQSPTGKFPTESPPDPDNGSPGTVGTVTALTPLRAIRKNCLSCCNGSTNEIALCPATSCSSWPFRFGHKPTDETIADPGNAVHFHAGRHSALMAIKLKCFDCSGASKSDVRNCAFAD